MSCSLIAPIVYSNFVPPRDPEDNQYPYEWCDDSFGGDTYYAFQRRDFFSGPQEARKSSTYERGGSVFAESACLFLVFFDLDGYNNCGSISVEAVVGFSTEVQLTSVAVAISAI